MAIPVEKLVIEIGGDSRKFLTELTKMKKGGKDFEKTMKSAAIVGTASFVAIGTAATALGVAAVKAFADFETGLVGVAKTADLEGKELEEFSDIIVAMSERIPVTTQALLEIATAAGQLGIKGGENIAIFTEVIAKLGATTDLQGEQAALTIARLINLTGESIKDVGKLGSVIVDLGNNFAATESEILEVAKDVAKATVQFKLSSAEILGISAAMASLGIAAEAGGTVVAKAFMAIDQAIREQAGPAFDKLIELTGLTGESLTQTFGVDAAKVFQLFIKGLGESGKEGKNLTEEMKALGLSGIRVNKILPTLAERSDILAKSMDRAGIASKNASALNIEAAKAFDTTASKLTIAQTKINNTLVKLGEEIAPDVIEAIELMSDAVKSSGPLWKALGGTIKLVAKGMSNIIKTFSAGIELIKKGSNSVEEFRKKNIKSAGDESDFLKKELEKRGITEGEFIRFQRKQRRNDRIENRKAVEDSQEKITKLIKKGEEDRTDEEKAQQKARAAQLKLTNEAKLKAETDSLTQIKTLNKIEFQLAKAKQIGASGDIIKILQDKFGSIKTMQVLENGIIVAKQGESLTALETEQNAHKTRLLIIEQAKFDGIIGKQDDFESNSQQSLENYLTNDADSLENQEINSGNEIIRTRDRNYGKLLDDQEDFASDSLDDYEDYVDDAQQFFDDNPLTIDIPATGIPGTGPPATDTPKTPIETEAERIVREEEICKQNGLVYDKVKGFCVSVAGTGTVSTTGDDTENSFNCSSAGLEYNSVTKKCCGEGEFYDGAGNCVIRRFTRFQSVSGEEQSDEDKLSGFLKGIKRAKSEEKKKRQRLLNKEILIARLRQDILDNQKEVDDKEIELLRLEDTGTEEEIEFKEDELRKLKKLNRLRDKASELRIKDIRARFDSFDEIVTTAEERQELAHLLELIKIQEDRFRDFIAGGPEIPDPEDPVIPRDISAATREAADRKECEDAGFYFATDGFCYSTKLASPDNEVLATDFNISSNLPQQSTSPVFSSSGTTGGTTANHTVFVQIDIADGAIDFITAKQREKGILGI